MNQVFRCVVAGFALFLACYAAARPNNGQGFLDAHENLYQATLDGAVDRVWSINSSGVQGLGVTVTPPTGYLPDQNSLPLLTEDSSGNLFFAHVLTPTSGSKQEIEVVKIGQSGAILRSFYYSPGTLSAKITGLALDTSGNAYLVAQYGTSLAGVYDQSVIFFLNNAFTTGYVQPISTPTYSHTYSTDVVADASGNIYVGSIVKQGEFGSATTGAVLLSKYSAATFLHGPIWQSVTVLPLNSAYVFDDEGTLSLDAGGRLTYLMPSCDQTQSTYSMFGVQSTANSVLNWSKVFAIPSYSGITSIVDANNNIYVLAATVSGPYVLCKISTVGSLVWGMEYLLAITNPQALALKSTGDIVVADTVLVNNNPAVGAQEWNPTTGALTGEGWATGTDPYDFGVNVYSPSASADTVYVTGNGEVNGAFPHPMVVKFAGSIIPWIRFPG